MLDMETEWKTFKQGIGVSRKNTTSTTTQNSLELCNHFEELAAMCMTCFLPL